MTKLANKISMHYLLHPRLLVADTFLQDLERVECHENKILLVKHNGNQSEMHSATKEEAAAMMQQITDNILAKQEGVVTAAADGTDGTATSTPSIPSIPSRTKLPVFGQSSSLGNCNFSTLVRRDSMWPTCSPASTPLPSSL